MVFWIAENALALGPYSLDSMSPRSSRAYVAHFYVHPGLNSQSSSKRPSIDPVSHCVPLESSGTIRAISKPAIVEYSCPCEGFSRESHALDPSRHRCIAKETTLSWPRARFVADISERCQDISPRYLQTVCSLE